MNKEKLIEEIASKIDDKEYLTEINSFDEYLCFLKNYFQKKQGELWYRGHSSNRWLLKPNLYRNAKMNLNPKDGIEVLRYNFVNFKGEFSKLKKEISDKNLFDTSELNDFQIMFIAQHYGLLTPILDWTTDPLVALFFALDDYTFKEEKEFPVIYILKPGLCNANSSIVYSNNTDITEPLCIDDMNDYFNKWTTDLNDSPANHIPIAIFSDIDFSHRICRQSGKFTLHGAVGPLNFSWNNTVIKKEKIVDEIKINHKAVEEMKKYLLALNINKQTIFRNTSSHLDNICEQIKKQEMEVFKDSIAQVNSALFQ